MEMERKSNLNVVIGEQYNKFKKPLTNCQTVQQEES